MRHCPKLQTAQLILRPFVTTDAPDVERLAGDRAVADTTMNVPYPYASGTAERWIASHQAKFDAGEQVVFAITLLETGELVGAIGLHVDALHQRAELGYWIGQAYWSRGYATEAGKAVIEYGFRQLQLHRIHACCFQRNPASSRVLEKLGLKREGVQRSHIRKWDKYEDVVLYGLLRSEWKRNGI
jgi:RimJ/RimL family protein N-acetyltransferase